jgi:hypothetical protein
MTFDKFDLAFYRALLATWMTIVLGPLLFDIGKQGPTHVVSAWTWLVGVALCVVPAWIGYRMGRAAERASGGNGNG